MFEEINRESLEALKQKSPSVAVVIPAYNESVLLPRTLDSIQESLWALSGVNASIIVADNGSSDDTAAIAKSLGAIPIIEPRKGVAYARQAGLMSLPDSVRFVLATDADSEVSLNWVKSHIQTLEGGDAVGSWGHYMTVIRDEDIPVDDMLLLKAYALATLSFREIKRLSGIGVFRGMNNAFNRETALQIGGYDVSLNLGEDVDFFLRLSERGKVSYTRDTLVYTSPRRIIGNGVKRDILGKFGDLLTLNVADRIDTESRPDFRI